MCGLVGFLSSEDRAASMIDALPSAREQLSHRGPDDFGEEKIRLGAWNVGLGHTRLSILDLSACGHQPMYSQDGRFCLAFNGEIYNYLELRRDLSALGYRFIGDSDTEVLLAAWLEWGEGSLVRLEGMFAFAVVDRVEKSVTLARDAFGIKPLYVAEDIGYIAFGSEIPSLQTLCGMVPAPNPDAMAQYLLWGEYDRTEQTFFEGVTSLLPGHVLTAKVEDNSLRTEIRRWWKPTWSQQAVKPDAELIELLRETFLQNVRRHLRSDVPLGVALSGGIDSSAVVCAIRYLEPDVDLRTFSFVARGSHLNEESWIDEVSAYASTISHKVELRPDEIVKDLDTLIRFQGEPFGSTSIYAQYRVYQLARESGVTVTLDGQGADELLAGYSGYVEHRLQSLISRHDFGSAMALLRSWSDGPARSSFAALMRLAWNSLGSRSQEFSKYVFSQAWAGAPPSWVERTAINSRHPMDEDSTRSGRYLAKELAREISGGRLAPLLRHGDRNSMRWSIESRVPFLTTGFADLALSLPEEGLLGSNGETKHFFRRAMRGIVPDPILDRKDKVGFATPEKEWLPVLGRETVEQWLSGLQLLPGVNAKAIRSDVVNRINGHRSINSSVWRALNAGRWAQIFLT